MRDAYAQRFRIYAFSRLAYWSAVLAVMLAAITGCAPSDKNARDTSGSNDQGYVAGTE